MGVSWIPSPNVSKRELIHRRKGSRWLVKEEGVGGDHERKERKTRCAIESEVAKYVL